MLTDVKRGVLYTIVTMTLFGGLYHLLIWGVGRAAFPQQAEGSLIRRADGTVVGFSLIVQSFKRAEYFHPRPVSTGGTNYSTGNPDQLKAVSERLETITKEENVSPGQVPSEMVTAGGSGLDPHIPPNAADLQVDRVARARNVDAEQIRDLVRAHTEPPALGVFGRDRVNVLELNLALDEKFDRAR
jgi:K+-transporting ATPase ATPase C chain